jgi:hypothetical protein
MPTYPTNECLTNAYVLIGNSIYTCTGATSYNQNTSEDHSTQFQLNVTV